MDLLVLFAAFCGGGFGAAFGGVAAYVFSGFLTLFGVVAGAAGVQFSILGTLSFGAFYGPQVGFAGAVAAAAYARRRGYIPSGRDIFTPLVSLKKPDVLVVGGLVGLLGYAMSVWLGTVWAGRLDTTAFTVFATAIISKLIFGKGGLGEIFNKAPQEIRKAGGRFSVNSSATWLPYGNTAAEKVVIGIMVGGGATWVTHVMLQYPSTAPVAYYIPYAISVVSLFFLQFGAPVYVTHHISLCAAYGMMMSGGNVWWGLAGGMLAVFLADVMARAFLLFGDTHVDPPATAIAATSFILFTLVPLTGTLNLVGNLSNALPVAILVAALVFAVSQSIAIRGKSETLNPSVPV
ncbi:hypothetical protein [Papillibacter cinnamivorans]|uniref:DUF7973 domain-containing protein n=1 Tax=Papillibacter cinnamivorans DSM 12816 TaxID=1122930 RepID=A0A1W1YJL1_9FIRM|nr:hypothetical protein [Papillibacter cinnamivorans]SMC36365.1 hypothetical protein SAMN02745168_0481 [Papillibacter cinnamivorans DSM 12816]